MIQLKGNGNQCVLFIITHPKKGNLIKTIPIATTALPSIVKIDVAWYDVGNFYNYIYGCNHTSAQCYEKLIPVFTASNTPMLLSFDKKSNLYSIYANTTFAVYNPNSEPFIIENYGRIDAGACVKYIDTQSVLIKNLNITRPRTSNKNVRYKDLSYEEQKTLIPSCVASINRIHTESFYDWVPANDIKLCTTLIYKETHDKEYHMVDKSTSIVYRYNIDSFRLMVPFIIKGRVTGTFIFQPHGARSNITYVPIPVSSVTSDETYHYRICNSDDSGDEALNV
jgi:hypothetical protein